MFMSGIAERGLGAGTEGARRMIGMTIGYKGTKLGTKGGGLEEIL